eukprot:gene41552-51469_t
MSLDGRQRVPLRSCPPALAAPGPPPLPRFGKPTADLIRTTVAFAWWHAQVRPRVSGEGLGEVKEEDRAKPGPGDRSTSPHPMASAARTSFNANGCKVPRAAHRFLNVPRGLPSVTNRKPRTPSSNRRQTRPIGMMTATSRLQKLVLLRPGEGRALLWAAAYFFFLLMALYLLRPVREAFGIARGADKLPWLMTGTMVVMLLVNPLYAALVSRKQRRRFIPLVSHFFAANLLVLAALFFWLPEHGGTTLGYVFYIWLSIFNLFVVSVFWSLMADVFTEDQGKRLFGMISMGGTLGAVVGAAVTEALSSGSLGVKFEPAALMLTAVIGLELAVLCM